MAKENEENKETYMEIQMLEAQMNAAREQMQDIDKKITEVKELKRSMEDFKKIEPGSDILLPVSNGIFAKGKLSDAKNLLVNVGSNVIVSKTTDEAKELVEKQIIELKKIEQKLAAQFNELTSKAQELASKIEDKA